MTLSSPGKRRAAAVKPREDRLLLGISLVVTAALIFAVLDTNAKWLVVNGYPSLEVVFVRYVVQLAVMLVWLVPRYGVGAFRTASPRLEVLRALALLGTTAFNFFAIKYLPLTITGSILFASPILVSVLSIPLLGEKVGWRRWLAILAGFAGVLVIIQPGGAEFHPAMFLSLAMVVSYALFNIVNRKLAGVDSTHVQQLYVALVPTICLLPFAFWDWQWPTGPVDWILLLSLGLGGLVGHTILTIAYRYAEASVLSPFIYPQVIFMAVTSWLVFSQPPGLTIFIGTPIVIGSGIYIWWREQKLANARQRTRG
jgi:drug/metabolite transporter (DMT)-like permease